MYFVATLDFTEWKRRYITHSIIVYIEEDDEFDARESAIPLIENSGLAYSVYYYFLWKKKSVCKNSDSFEKYIEENLKIKKLATGNTQYELDKVQYKIFERLRFWEAYLEDLL